MRAFWCSTGWLSPPKWPAHEEFSKAVASGVMFAEPMTGSHDEAVESVARIASAVGAEEVGAAFAASLTSRRLDLRSALGSYAVARHVTAHAYEPAELWCAVCGLVRDLDDDLNVLSFERFKWGGVRRADLKYAAFDLDQFTRAPQLEPTDSDLAQLRQLLQHLRTAAPEATALQVAGNLGFIVGNEAERQILLEILAVAGVLDTPEHPSYRTAFIPSRSRVNPGRHNEDREYPMPWWRGSDGLNEEAIAEWFPFL